MKKKLLDFFINFITTILLHHIYMYIVRTYLLPNDVVSMIQNVPCCKFLYCKPVYNCFIINSVCFEMLSYLLQTFVPGFILKFLGLSQKKGRFLLIGLDFSGKTTLLHLLKTGTFCAAAPTLHGSR